MTANKDTNESAKQPNDDVSWEAFLDSHSNDVNNLEHSHTARKFERHARKVEKKKVLDASDLTSDSFAVRQGKGPRDFSTSWLDVDDSLGEDDFVPGPANVGNIKRTTFIFAIMTIVGVLGLVALLFIPQLAGILGTIFGVVTLIGAVGLFIQLRGHNETRSAPFDDGARV